MHGTAPNSNKHQIFPLHPYCGTYTSALYAKAKWSTRLKRSCFLRIPSMSSCRTPTAFAPAVKGALGSIVLSLQRLAITVTNCRTAEWYGKSHSFITWWASLTSAVCCALGASSAERRPLITCASSSSTRTPASLMNCSIFELLAPVTLFIP
ncbi:hypothetical protein D3C71_1621400 [compost metagenome]